MNIKNKWTRVSIPILFALILMVFVVWSCQWVQRDLGEPVARGLIYASVNRISTDAYASLDAAVAAVGGTEASLIVRKQVLAGSVVIPSNISLYFERNGTISVTVGATTTIFSPDNIIAGTQQNIFTGPGNVAFTNAGSAWIDWWGPDGTSDEDEFNEALDQLSLASGHGILRLGDNTWDIDGGIFVEDDVDMIGNGWSSVIRDVSVPVGAGMIRSTTAKRSNIMLRDFVLNRTSGNLAHGLNIDNVDHLRIEGLKLIGPPGFLAGGAMYINNDAPVDGVQAVQVSIVNNHLVDCGGNGIQIGNTDGAIIASNVFTDCYREVIGIEPRTGGKAENVAITGNSLYWHDQQPVPGAFNANGMIIITQNSGGTVRNVTISGNSIDSNVVITHGSPITLATQMGTGIAILGGGSEINIVGNSVKNMAGPCVAIDASNNRRSGDPLIPTQTIRTVNLVGNTFIDCDQYDNTTWPFKYSVILDNAKGVVVANNIISGTTHDSGVREGPLADQNVIRDNLILGAEVSPIAINGIDTKVHDNVTSATGNKFYWTSGGSDGRYGFNQIDPVDTMHISGTLRIQPSVPDAFRVRELDNGADVFRIQSGTSSGVIQGREGDSETMRLHTGTANPSWIDGTGGLGIGTQYVTATLHVNQMAGGGAKPVLRLEQLDVSEEFIRLIGTAASGNLTQSIVDTGDVTTATIAGYFEVYVRDDGNQVADASYYVPFYSLQ